MSFVIAAPEFMSSAASDLANIESALRSAHAAAAGPTSNVLAAAGDEVSAAIASLFGAHGQAYQALSAQAAA
ncbi:PE family protein, partial [Mycobacterium sp. E2327]